MDCDCVHPTREYRDLHIHTPGAVAVPEHHAVPLRERRVDGRVRVERAAVVVPLVFDVWLAPPVNFQMVELGMLVAPRNCRGP